MVIRQLVPAYTAAALNFHSRITSPAAVKEQTCIFYFINKPGFYMNSDPDFHDGS